MAELAVNPHEFGEDRQIFGGLKDDSCQNNTTVGRK